MSESAATIWAAIIGVMGLILVSLVSGILVWMFAIVRKITDIEGRIRGIGQQLREVPKRRTDHENSNRD